MPASLFADWATAPTKSLVTRVIGVTPEVQPSISAALQHPAEVTRTAESRVTEVIAPIPTRITQVTLAAGVGLVGNAVQFQCNNPGNLGNRRKREYLDAAPEIEGIGDNSLTKPVLFPNGRRLWRFRAASIPGRADDRALELIQVARSSSVVLVADGPELIVVEPWLSTLGREALQALMHEAGAVIAALRGEIRARLVEQGASRQ